MAASRLLRVRTVLPAVTLEVDVDAELLRIALVNLLANAVRHSPSDSIVTVSTQDDENQVRIAVTDHGPGVDAGDAEHLFDAWRQGASASAGLGLGLWITRQIVGWHGGRIVVESAAGRGSRFSIVLPSDS